MNRRPQPHSPIHADDPVRDEIYDSERAPENVRASFAPRPVPDTISDFDRVAHLLSEALGEAIAITATAAIRSIDDAAALCANVAWRGRRWMRLFRSERTQWRVIAEAIRVARDELVAAGCARGVRLVGRAAEMAAANVKRHEPVAEVAS